MRAIADRASGEAALFGLDAAGDTISARLRLGGDEQPIRFRVPGATLSASYDPFIAATLPVAMRRAASMTVDGPVSARLLASLPRIQGVLVGMDRSFRNIEIAAPAAEPIATGSTRGVAAYFSGGLDTLPSRLVGPTLGGARSALRVARSRVLRPG